MRIEHFAFNVPEAEVMVAWYQEYLRMPIYIERQTPVYVAFLGEPPSLLEIYNNPTKPYLQPQQMEPLTLHLALHSEHPGEDRRRLECAGAHYEEGSVDEDGYGLVMMRCPWGMPLQLCRRRVPLVGESD